MPEKPAMVSVVIPTYNRAQLVGRAIRSVLAQTFQDWELFVVDDGSTDNTEGVVRSFVDPRIYYLHHEANRGASAARNTGIRASRSEYIAFLDSDDEWLPEKLEKQLEIFRTTDLPNVAMVLCGRKCIEDKGAFREEESTLRGQIYEDLLGYRIRFMPTSAFLVRRSVVDQGILFDENLVAFQDWDFLVSLSQKFLIDTVRQPLFVQHRDYGGDHIFNQINIPRARQHILQKYTLELCKRPKIFASHHKRIAGTYCYGMRDVGAVRRHLFMALRANPLEPMLYLWLLTSLLGLLPLRAMAAVLRQLSHPFVTLGLLRQVPSPFQ